MGDTFEPELGMALNTLFPGAPPPPAAPKRKPKPVQGHAAVEAREDNVLRVKFGK